jgi:rubrerythrin
VAALNILRKNTNLTMLNEIEAALYLKMSPSLIRWLTSHAPKKGESRKLRFLKKEGSKLFFEEAELDSFNKYLQEPWPVSPNQKRPNIPNEIDTEIKQEARFRCAICEESEGEIAHIDPVHLSKCNHPHNLIYLCPNCHTKYDLRNKFTVIEIKKVKQCLLDTRYLFWEDVSNLSNAILRVIKALESIAEFDSPILKRLSNEHFKEEMLNKLQEVVERDLNEANQNSPEYRNKEKYTELTTELRAIVKSSRRNKEDEVIQARYEYLESSAEAECPLCKGSGSHNNWECPICRGVGTVDKMDLSEIDLSEFKQAECPLCKGSGSRNNRKCLICRGVGTVDNRDLSAFES